MACTHYDLDMTAARFGDCKCGHSRAEHTQDALHVAPGSHSHVKVESHAHEAVAEGSEYHGPCDHYNVNMTASEFGLCKCGFKKADHGKPRELFMTKKADAPALPASRAQPAAEPAPAAPAPQAHAEPPAHAAGGKKVSAVPCDHYELDITGTFGFCKCGHSREEHKQAGTLKEPELKIFAGGHLEDKKRATIAPSKAPAPTGKQAKPCDNYHVDMQGKTFGDCVCGHARAKHAAYKSDKKGMNNDPDEEEAVPEPVVPAPRVIVRDGTHPCEVFELDLKNTGGYGFCICSFSRLDHEQFHQDPAEWHRVKDSLTAPKPFT